MWLKGTLLIIFALFIDLLQAGVSLSIMGVLASINVIPVVGQVASMAGLPIGVILGVAINSSISLTAGVGHTFATFLTYSSGNSRIKTKIQGMILRRLGVALFGEIIPGINNLPWWTISTLLTIRAVHKEERKAAAAAAEAPEAPERPAPETADIRPQRPANDTNPAYATAA